MRWTGWVLFVVLAYLVFFGTGEFKVPAEVAASVGNVRDFLADKLKR
jgi:hypothetical protein